MSVLASWRATWRDILTDKGAILMLFIASLIYSMFYPLPYTYEHVDAVPVSVLDRDQSSSSRELRRLLEAAPGVNVVLHSQDSAAMQDAVWRGDVLGGIVIPTGFHRDLLSGRPATIQVAGHGGYLLAGSAVLNTVMETATTMGAAISLQRLQALGAHPAQAGEQHRPVDVVMQPLYNPSEGYGSFVVPGVMVLIIQQTLLIGVTLVLGTRSENGTLPRGPAAYTGMLLAFSTIAFGNALYFFGFSLWYHDYPYAGSLPGLLAFSAVFAVTIAAVALAVARAFTNREQGLQLLLATAIPMFFLSGYPWPAEAMPAALEWARWLLPSTAGIQGFIGLNQMGVGLGGVLRELLVLGALALIATIAGLLLYRQN